MVGRKTNQSAGDGRSATFSGKASSNILTIRVHPKVVSELLGHSSIGLTLDIYSHVIPDMQQQAVAAIHTLLRG
jgi:hypothetical protein